MTYLRVAWKHSFQTKPVELFSELDANRNEMRKIERFRDGDLQYAGPESFSGDTRLAEASIPAADMIAEDPQFNVSPISREEFEQLWQSATISTAA